MIHTGMISYEYKCVYIHIPKTGGTTIETLFGEKHDHDNQEEIIEKIGMPAWQSYLKFSIVRNPWDRMVSAYSYVNKPCPFKEWLNKDRTDWFWLIMAKPQLDWVKGVDHIIRFENYTKGLQDVCGKLGKDFDKVPRANKSKHGHYSLFYDDDTIEFVKQMYQKDIDYFEYEFSGV